MDSKQAARPKKKKPSNLTLIIGDRTQTFEEKKEGQIDEIIDNLFLGDSITAATLKHFEDHKIKHVISMYRLDQNTHDFYEKENIKLHPFYIRDKQDANIIEVFPRTNEIIQSALERGEPVLVHCMRGISRSVSVILAYIMTERRMSYDEAYDFVKSKRHEGSETNPNIGFYMSLKEWGKMREESL